MQPDWIQMNCRKWKKKDSLQCRYSLLTSEDPGGWVEKGQSTAITASAQQN